MPPGQIARLHRVALTQASRWDAVDTIRRRPDHEFWSDTWVKVEIAIEERLGTN